MWLGIGLSLLHAQFGHVAFSVMHISPDTDIFNIIWIQFPIINADDGRSSSASLTDLILKADQGRKEVSSVIGLCTYTDTLVHSSIVHTHYAVFQNA